MTIRKTTRNTIPAAQFKARCLELLDRVERTRRPLVVTKRGRPVAQLAPLEPRKVAGLEGSLLFEGDVVSPVGETWDADR